MNIFPAIDLFDGKAVRLYKGDYNQMTVYSEEPEKVALYFKECGAEYIHLVDLEGAKSGDTPNFETVKRIIRVSGLKAEIGGGIRNEETIVTVNHSAIIRSPFKL
jgi:phosphoribosylformimino-5-aminoimidazole carboxamide ribotide isomerase